MNLRGDYSAATPDYVVEQDWSEYTPQQHGLWAALLDRQLAMVKRYGAPQFLAGLSALDLERRIPRFDAASGILRRATGWRSSRCRGSSRKRSSSRTLAERRFPVTVWLRTPAEMNYLVEPDVFHDFFGHVPLLCDPVFADFVQAYGIAGRKAAAEGGVKMLARLYWYSVEFGLIKAADGLRAYGAGILSSGGETAYSIDSPVPHRISFDLERVMRTDYLIDAYQKSYFVVENFPSSCSATATTGTLLPSTVPSGTPPVSAPDEVLPTDVVLNRGTPVPANATGR